MRAIRLAAAALALALLPVFVPGTASPVAADSRSCTGWTSRIVPPETIRVLRRTGQVVEVPFRDYVARVMVSGEWPDWLPYATLKAGAFASKQYAWYYALAGNHRSTYVKDGKCYDVKDSTIDQMYAHFGKPTERQKRARDAMWDLSLRRESGDGRIRFILTGYRSFGGSYECGKDADSWKLYATSAQDCGDRGWTGRQILTRYYGGWRVSFRGEAEAS
ncbi:MAG: SpoIID/LytB domain-containing protein [Chloroflexi bacterium]|nr:SpoIID/LytB domain-containing protein [Chloroflexota bacterium]